MTSRAPPKRKRLKGIPRQQWDGVHPSPLAHQIQAQFVDKELVRYQIVQETPTRLVTYCRLPSPAQVEAHCTSCPGSKHIKDNPLCAGSRAVVRHLRRGRLYYMENPSVEKEGRWKRVNFYIPERYRSGTADFVRV